MPGNPRNPSNDPPAITRSQVETSNALWESYVALYTKSLADLRLFSTESAPASLQTLVEALNRMDDTTDIWELWSLIKTVQNQDTTYQRKIKVVDRVLSNMDDEVMRTPVSLTHPGIVSSMDRQAAVNLYHLELDTAKELYNGWWIIK